MHKVISKDLGTVIYDLSNNHCMYIKFIILSSLNLLKQYAYLGSIEHPLPKNQQRYLKFL